MIFIFRYTSLLASACVLLLVAACSDTGRHVGASLRSLEDLANDISLDLSDIKTGHLLAVQKMPEDSMTARSFCESYSISLYATGRRALTANGADVMIRRVGTVLVLWTHGWNRKDEMGRGDDMLKIIELDKIGKDNPFEESQNMNPRATP